MELGVNAHIEKPLIQSNVPLHNKNWFGTGGAARYFCNPTNSSEFKQALKFADNKKVDIFVFGAGANLLICDSGFNGLAICPKMNTISFQQVDDYQWNVTAGTGVLIDDLILRCVNKELVGLEPFSGIPGTVGGAVFINLHYFSARIENSFIQGQVINRRTGITKTLKREDFRFGYNDSILHDSNFFLLNATFSIRKTTPLEAAYTRGRRDEIIRHRNARYPTERTCGSFFRNFHQHELKRGNKKATLPYIAYYLDKAGVKGSLRSGGAVVSHKHANMIITDRDDATSIDIINLACKMQDIIFENFGLIPQLECQLLGFPEYPLRSW